MTDNDEQRIADLVRRATMAATEQTLRDVSLIAADDELDEMICALSIHTAEDEIEKYGPNSQVAWSGELRTAMLGNQVSTTVKEQVKLPQKPSWVKKVFGLFATPRFAFGTCLAVCIVAVLIAIQMEKQFSLKQRELAATVTRLTRSVDSLDVKQRTLTSEIQLKDREIADLVNRTPIRQVTDNGNRTVSLQDGRKIRLADVSENQLIQFGALRVISSKALNSTATPAGDFDFKILSPNRTIIATRTPVLKWNKAGTERGIRYRVSIARDIETQKVEPENYTERTVFKVTDKAIEPGGIYTWWVEATLKDRVIKSDVGRCQILRSPDLEFANAVLADEHLTHLQRAVFAASLGLLDDATSELNNADFNRAEVKQALLRQLDKARAND